MCSNDFSKKEIIHFSTKTTCSYNRGWGGGHETGNIFLKGLQTHLINTKQITYLHGSQNILEADNPVSLNAVEKQEINAKCYCYTCLPDQWFSHIDL